jgi:hypothetical protein
VPQRVDVERSVGRARPLNELGADVGGTASAEQRTRREGAWLGLPCHQAVSNLGGRRLGEVASTPKPAPVTTVRPSATARSCPLRTAWTPGNRCRSVMTDSLGRIGDAFDGCNIGDRPASATSVRT